MVWSTGLVNVESSKSAIVQLEGNLGLEDWKISKDLAKGKFLEAIHKNVSNPCKRGNISVKQIMISDDGYVIAEDDLRLPIQNLKSYNDIIKTDDDEDDYDGNNDKNTDFSCKMALYQCCVNDLVRFSKRNH